MRVNHAGEIMAQGLYQGQALTARLDTVRDAMEQAAIEEFDHLAWCEARLQELRDRPSRLGPVWYTGAFVLGAGADDPHVEGDDTHRLLGLRPGVAPPKLALAPAVG
jgi:demethoxyubiquinone hydroxylase (CLK1/Coq7/Cat5 family)